ncbi:hypothetical protein HYALB_00007145 [Hymenoscyphus albidus]|uniref:Uncharacterized protein n=1 Tax=Hymenoscyphus albidus TaxID=595503 RepID=A0A9N9Q2H6_9HELO|nr:hypothetical protein HYALB_00007145 [Hymenoscyphus albidus]
MAPKSKVRAFNRAPKSKIPSAPSSASSKLPKPFAPAPKSLEPLLATLPKGHVYITSIDSHPADFKKKIFLVPVFMNILLLLAMFYRIRSIGPYYMKICHSLMGKKNELTMNTRKMTREAIGMEILRRTASFMVDFVIYVFVWPWPKAFFIGQAIGNPVNWRLKLGFKEREIIVRRSRRWFVQSKSLLEEGSKEQGLLFNNVGRATDPMWMSEKTGYLMLNKEWDLDWKSMVTAAKLVEKGDMKLDDYKTTILLHDDDFGWVVIETAEAGGSLKEEEGRRKIVAFKDELTVMGKESLFFRWIELVQYESSQPGGFGPEQQKKTMEKARQLFENEGIDFDKFWEKVGGMKGMPGMDEM